MTCKYTVTLKPGLVITQFGIDTVQSVTYDLLLKWHDNYGPISYRFRDRRRFQSKIAKLAMRMHATT